MLEQQLLKMNFSERFEEAFGIKDEQTEKIISAYSSATSAFSANVDARMNYELEALRKTDKFKNASSDAQTAMEKKKTDKFRTQRKIAWVAERSAAIASATLSIMKASIEALAVPPVPNVFLAGVTKALGAVQLGAMIATPMPEFAQGGLIGGRRHSQGGTMINAERGEFVMSRNAVSSIGVENLNRMNDGGGGSQSISININGGMISPEFVENELAEAIREATRRGASFGLS